MDRNEKQLARIMFRNKVLAASGIAFEDLFTRIMEASRPGFRQIKPQGAVGDRKNDGFEPESGRYFQVYAPEQLSARTQQALNKIETDFQGLMRHWAGIFPAGIQEFYFVVNDRYQAVYASIHEALERLRIEYGLSRCEPFLARHLEDELFSLPEERIIDIVGFLPDPEAIQILDFSLVNEVIAHVMENPEDLTEIGRLVAPDFDTKIQFNGLDVTGNLLTSAYYQVAAVEDFFAANSNFARQDVRETLNGHYLVVKELHYREAVVSGQVTAGDLRFMELLRRICPQGEGPRQKKALQEAALALLAMFFESCDIFEDPEG